MKNRHHYFSIASRIFWLIVVLILVLAVFRPEAPFFNKDKAIKKIVWTEEEKKQEEGSTDTDSSDVPTPPQPDSLKTFTWSWRSVQSGELFEMTFIIPIKSIKAAQQNRSSLNGFNSIFDVYRTLYKNDLSLLEPMIQAYINLAREKRLDRQSTMEMVVSSIQSIDYTWVLDEQESCGSIISTPDGPEQIPPYNCVVQADPQGCCDGINYGLYSPLEFATKRTGDCDTRSLFAFTVLKKMGFDVAVMLSQQEHHSVLGVQVPFIPGDGRRGNVGRAKFYFLWELTAYGPVLGQYINGNDWEIALN